MVTPNIDAFYFSCCSLLESEPTAGRSIMASSIPNRGPELLAIDAVFMSLAIVANSLRCYVRISMVKAFGLDD